MVCILGVFYSSSVPVNVAHRHVAGATRVGVTGSRGRTLLPRGLKDAQNRAITSGTSVMSANVSDFCSAGPKTPGWSKKRHRLAVAVSLTVLLSGAEVSAGGEDGPMASAPLPPLLPAAPPSSTLQQPQDVAPSRAARRVLPQCNLRAERGMQVAHLHKRNDPHRVDHSKRAAQGERRLGQRAEAYTVPQAASTMIAPLAPLPFPFGYMPGAPPAYGYALVYPPPWPPGPALPR